ncbi:MAG: MGMT family protein [Candidatus Hydrogenedentes bacterium]|nr:MGMT family protein [Candidatus Hydrogenedentota bacterium]
MTYGQIATLLGQPRAVGYAMKASGRHDDVPSLVSALRDGQEQRKHHHAGRAERDQTQLDLATRKIARADRANADPNRERALKIAGLSCIELKRGARKFQNSVLHERADEPEVDVAQHDVVEHTIPPDRPEIGSHAGPRQKRVPRNTLVRVGRGRPRDEVSGDHANDRKARQ